MDAYVLKVERSLGDQDQVGSAGEACRHGDPSRTPAHHLHQHDTVMALRRTVEPVDRVRGDLHGRPEADARIRAREIVVDRLRHSDDGQSFLGHVGGGTQRALAADRDQPVERQIGERSSDLRGPSLVVRIRTGAPEDRAAPMEDALNRLLRQLPDVAVHHAAPAVSEPEHLGSVNGRALPDDRPDGCVQAGSVATARQDADPHHAHTFPKSRTEGGLCPAVQPASGNGPIGSRPKPGRAARAAAPSRSGQPAVALPCAQVLDVGAGLRGMHACQRVLAGRVSLHGEEVEAALIAEDVQLLGQVGAVPNCTIALPRRSRSRTHIPDTDGILPTSPSRSPPGPRADGTTGCRAERPGHGGASDPVRGSAGGLLRHDQRARREAHPTPNRRGRSPGEIAARRAQGRPDTPRPGRARLRGSWGCTAGSAAPTSSRRPPTRPRRRAGSGRPRRPAPRAPPRSRRRAMRPAVRTGSGRAPSSSRAGDRARKRLGGG